MQRPIDRYGMKQLDENCNKSFWMRKRAGSVALLFTLLLAICIAPVLAQKEPASKDLKAFYQQNCTRCHGPDGSAVSAEGKKLRGRNFTDPKWLRDTGDDEMVKIILKGIFFGWVMPSFKDILTADEAQRMVTDLIRMSKKGQVIAPDLRSPGGK
jgi:mono/diheme cytochrome c family protein